MKTSTWTCDICGKQAVETTSVGPPPEWAMMSGVVETAASGRPTGPSRTQIPTHFVDACDTCAPRFEFPRPSTPPPVDLTGPEVERPLVRKVDPDGVTIREVPLSDDEQR